MLKQKTRIYSLDIFRIASVFIVFLFHSQMHLGCNYGIFQDFVKMGAIFMTAFFMLSGFVLFVTYKDYDFTQKENIKIFLLKRAIAIMPIYIILMLPRSFIYLLCKNSDFVQYFTFLPVELFGIQSFFSSLFSVSHTGGTWFVSCLLFAYFFYPYLQYLVSIISSKQKKELFLVLSFILLWAPIVAYVFKTNSIYENPIFRLIEFSLGIILASLLNDENFNYRICTSRISLVIEIVLLVVLVSLVFSLTGIRNYMLYSWISLPLFALMIVYSYYNRLELSGIKRKIISYLCEISYVFFLVQYPVWKITRCVSRLLGEESNIAIICISIFLCLILSIMAHEIFEKPATNFLRKKYLKS